MTRKEAWLLAQVLREALPTLAVVRITVAGTQVTVRAELDRLLKPGNYLFTREELAMAPEGSE